MLEDPFTRTSLIESIVVCATIFLTIITFLISKELERRYPEDFIGDDQETY